MPELVSTGSGAATCKGCIYLKNTCPVNEEDRLLCVLRTYEDSTFNNYIWSDNETKNPETTMGHHEGLEQTRPDQP